MWGSCVALCSPGLKSWRRGGGSSLSPLPWIIAFTQSRNRESSFSKAQSHLPSPSAYPIGVRIWIVFPSFPEKGNTKVRKSFSLGLHTTMDEVNDCTYFFPKGHGLLHQGLSWDCFFLSHWFTVEISVYSQDYLNPPRQYRCSWTLFPGCGIFLSKNISGSFLVCFSHYTAGWMMVRSMESFCAHHFSPELITLPHQVRTKKTLTKWTNGGSSDGETK